MADHTKLREKPVDDAPTGGPHVSKARATEPPAAARPRSPLPAPDKAAASYGFLFDANQQAFAGWSQAFSLFPGVSGVYLRRAFYRLMLPQCGEGACLTFGTVFSHPTTRIGRNVYAGTFCVLGDATLEDDVLLGSHVSIINGGAQHGIERLDFPVREQQGSFPRVTIGCDSWIGDRAIVMSDVGKHCVVAAGAVVTKPVPDYAIVAGVPARMIGSRARNEATARESFKKPGEVCIP